MVQAPCLNHLRVVRGAPTRGAGFVVGSVPQPTATASWPRCRRGMCPVSQSNTGIDKVPGFQGCGRKALSASVACAGWSANRLLNG
jgi:hypothetical protein